MGGPLFDRLPPDEPDDDLLGRFLDYVADKGLTLYPAQEEALLELFEGRNFILNTPTGSGKSLVASGLQFASLAHLRGEQVPHLLPQPLRSVVERPGHRRGATHGATRSDSHRYSSRLADPRGDPSPIPRPPWLVREPGFIIGSGVWRLTLALDRADGALGVGQQMIEANRTSWVTGISVRVDSTARPSR